jgi:hypothetical protein
MPPPTIRYIAFAFQPYLKIYGSAKEFKSISRSGLSWLPSDPDIPYS